MRSWFDLACDSTCLLAAGQIGFGPLRANDSIGVALDVEDGFLQREIYMGMYGNLLEVEFRYSGSASASPDQIARVLVRSL